MTENYCLQQLRDGIGILPQYFVQGQNSEIDFVLQNGMEIIPAEVKAGNGGALFLARVYSTGKCDEYTIVSGKKNKRINLRK